LHCQACLMDFLSNPWDGLGFCSHHCYPNPDGPMLHL
jgi:hypothetical protein